MCASSRHLRPASTANDRRSRSGKTPNRVLPAPTTATRLISSVYSRAKVTVRLLRYLDLRYGHPTRYNQFRPCDPGKTRFHVFRIGASSRCTGMLRAVASEVIDPVSETVQPGLAQELERQNRFVSDHLRRIFVQIYRIVGNVADAQDLTQETFIKALQRQDQLKETDKAAHWLSRNASNTAIDFLRRNGKVNFCEIDSLVEPLTEPTDSPEQAVIRSEHRAYLEEGLMVLTERERTALLLRDVEGLPAEEVARQLNCSKATVRSHIANARVKLRKYLDRHPNDRPRRGKV